MCLFQVIIWLPVNQQNISSFKLHKVLWKCSRNIMNFRKINLIGKVKPVPPEPNPVSGFKFQFY